MSTGERNEEMTEIILKGYDIFPDGVMITDNEGQVAFFNQVFKKIWHISQETMIYSDFRFPSPAIAEIISDLDLLIPWYEDQITHPEKTGNIQIHEINGTILDLQTSPIIDDTKGYLGRIWICKDVTESVKNLDRLNHSEQLFRMIFNLIPEGIAISDLTGTFLEVNAHFSECWGYTREEVLGKNAIELNFWVDLTERTEIIRLLQEKGIYEKIPVKMRRKGGEVRDILLSGRLISIDDIPYMLSIPYDITELVKSEKRIRSLASFIELSPNPIFEINGEGVITMHNEAMERVVTRITGTSDLTVFIPDKLDEILDAIHDSIETSFYREISLNNHYFMEHVYITKQYRTARIYVNDITHKKRAEEELLKKNDDLAAAYEEIMSSEEELREQYERLVTHENALSENKNKLQAIVNHIPGLVVTTDTRMRVTSIFGAGLSDLGLVPNQGIGRNIFDLIPGTDPKFIEGHRNALLGRISAQEGEYQGRNYLLFTEPLNDSRGEIIGTMGIAFDITDQRRLEGDKKSLLSQLEKNLVELAVLNDKIRNPLTVISTLIAMYAPEIEPQANQCILEIDDIIINLDKRWLESEKTIHFLKKHYGVGV